MKDTTTFTFNVLIFYFLKIYPIKYFKIYLVHNYFQDSKSSNL